MTDVATNGIRFTKDGGLGHITLDRPDRLNTIDLDVATRLLEIAVSCSHDEELRAVLLDGSGRSFCGGGDVKAFAALGSDLPAYLREVTANLHAALTLFARLSTPIVVAAQGGVAGAGLGLVAIGDIVLASESAKFVFAYNAIGLAPDGGTSWMLPRLLGPRRAMDLALTNRQMDAAEALRSGLVSRVIPHEQLVAEALAVAEQLAAGPTQSFGLTKRLLHEAWTRSYPEQLAAESEALSGAAGTADGQEGIAAFVERRPPKFTGR